MKDKPKFYVNMQCIVQYGILTTPNLFSETLQMAFIGLKLD